MLADTRLREKDGSLEINLDNPLEASRDFFLRDIGVNQGEILTADHEFQKLCEKICRKLKLPSDTKIVTVDNEDPYLAYFSPSVKMIVIGKGAIAEWGDDFEVFEDHIAGLVSHEMTHAIKHSNYSELSEIQKMRMNRDYEYAGHNEEHEADRIGMIMISEAGYNPRAMIDRLEQRMRLDLQNYGTLSHPSDLERANHLKKILFDDEHPLQGTERELTPISEELQDWIKSPSEMTYELTDKLVEGNIPEIEQMLMDAKNPEEYLAILGSLRHSKKIANAMEIARTNILDRVAKKSLVIKAFRVALKNSKLGSTQNNANVKMYFYEQPSKEGEGSIMKSFVINDDDRDFALPEFILAESYRTRVASSQNEVDETVFEEYTSNALKAEAIMDAEFTKVINAHYDFFKPLTPTETSMLGTSTWRDYYDPNIDPAKQFVIFRSICVMLLDYFKNDDVPANEDLIAMVYQIRDRAIVPIRYNGQSPELIDKMTNSSIDFNLEAQKYFLGIKESIASKAPETITASDDELRKFSDLLFSEYGFSERVSEIISILLLTNYENKLQLIEELSDNEIRRLIELHRNLSLVKYGRLSEKRQTHTDYKHSITDAYPESTRSEKENALNTIVIADDYLDDLARVFIGRTYTNNSPRQREHIFENYEFTVTRIDNLSVVSLSLEDWYLLKLIYPKAEPYFRGKGVLDYLECMRTNSQPSNLILQSFRETQAEQDSHEVGDTKEWDSSVEISMDDALILLEKQPWGYEYTLKYVSHFVLNWQTDFYGNSINEINEYKDNVLKIQQALKIFEGYTKYDNQGDVAFYSRLLLMRKRIANGYINMNLKEAELLKRKDSTYEFTKEEEFKKAIKSCLELGIVQNIGDVFDTSSYIDISSLFSTRGNMASRFLLSASEADLSELISFENTSTRNSSTFTFQEGLKLLSLFDPIQDNKIPDLLTINQFAEAGSERAYTLYLLAYGEIYPPLIEVLNETHGANIGTWIIENFRATDASSRLFAYCINRFIGSDREQLIQQWVDWISENNINPDQAISLDNPTQKFARRTSRFEVDMLIPNNPFANTNMVATTQSEYDDLFTRRHPFQNVGEDSMNLPNKYSINNAFDFKNSMASHAGPMHSSALEKFGNIQQRVIAERLAKSINEFTDSNIPLQERIVLLQESCPVKSIVRDIHIERMIRTVLANTKQDIFSIIRECSELFDLLASDEYQSNYAQKVIYRWIQEDPNIINNAVQALDFIETYLPHATVGRNAFLEFIEQNCNLPTEVLERVTSLRLNEELQTESGQGKYNIALLNGLSKTMNRAQKRESVLWLIRIIKSNPQAILNAQNRLKGSLDNTPFIFLDLTINERRTILEKFMIGREGILDLSNLPQQRVVDARQERYLFLETLANELIPDTADNYQLFREIFIVVFEEAEPVRATQIVINLINKVIDSQKKGLKLGVEEVLSDSLCSLGIVGKKVAQTLAELDIPVAYKEALRSSQEGTDSIPKRALHEMARHNNLLDGSAGLQIVAFNQPLGSASNKQACLLDVKITSDEYAEKLNLPVGSIIQLVGKFKRPSAQKIDNLRNDMKLLGKVMEVLEKRGVAKSLPPNMEKQIETAITRELRFADEKAFNLKLAEDLRRRSKFGDYSIKIPEIVFATDEIVLETQAQGTSLRKIIDSNLVSDKEMTNIKAGILSEIIVELLRTGNIHADLHPGNIFIDIESKVITLIDLGMNVQLTFEEVQNIRSLMIALAQGNMSSCVSALAKMGWKIEEKDLLLSRIGVMRQIGSLIRRNGENALVKNFLSNVNVLLQASRMSKSPPPENIGLVILALSKLEPYFGSMDLRNFMNIISRVAS